VISFDRTVFGADSRAFHQRQQIPLHTFARDVGATTVIGAFAGVLLIVPGVISDAIALLLLLSLLIRPRKAIVRDDVIEGEWRRED